MTLTESDVCELLDAIRKGVELVLQAVIDAEAAEVIGAGATSVPKPAPPGATGPETGGSPPRPATWTCASPS